jgi:hypothetical protein
MKNGRGQDNDGEGGDLNAIAITGVVGGSIRTTCVPRQVQVIGRQECDGARSSSSTARAAGVDPSLKRTRRPKAASLSAIRRPPTVRSATVSRSNGGSAPATPNHIFAYMNRLLPPPWSSLAEPDSDRRKQSEELISALCESGYCGCTGPGDAGVAKRLRGQWVWQN